MKWTTIRVSSVTNAMRGKRVLESRGYTVYLKRTAHPSEEEGCGYSLHVHGDGSPAEELRRAGIRVLRVTDGGVPL